MAEELGGREAPAVGFGLGLERALLALEEEGVGIPGPVPLDVFVASAGEAAEDTARKILFDLRRQGFSADTDHAGRSLKAQMRRAAREGARRVVILGEEELARGVVAVRDMVEGDQVEVSIGELISTLRRSYLTT